MKNLSRHNGTLEIIERLPNSYYGNPRYLATVGGFSFRTAPDSSMAYSLPNYRGKRVEVLLGSYYGKTTLHSIKEA
jgi:hypothetical protein